MEYYAHSLEGRPVSEWHRLEEHLKETAELAEKFAAEFGLRGMGVSGGIVTVIYEALCTF